MGFGLMSWHTHAALMGSADRVQLQRSTASLLAVAVTQGAGAQENPTTADKGKEEEMQTKDIYKASSGAKGPPSSPTRARARTHTHTHTHTEANTHVPLSSTYKPMHTGTRSSYLHTVECPLAWLASCLLMEDFQAEMLLIKSQCQDDFKNGNLNIILTKNKSHYKL